MQKNYLEAKEKCDAKLDGVFLFKRKKFIRFASKQKIAQVKVKRKILCELSEKKK